VIVQRSAVKTNALWAQHTTRIPRVLLVEPQEAIRAVLCEATRAIAQVADHESFASARFRLLDTSVDFLVTNLHLGAFNGLHLVYLAAARGASARSIVYTERQDLALAREVQNAGAFYETRECLSVSLPAYLAGALPQHDRRNPACRDRRALVRGGRRSWDHRI
jgi:DNA-binding NtrC family response regulator